MITVLVWIWFKCLWLKAYGSLVYIFKFIFSFSLLCFVPMLCSLVLVKCYVFSLSTSLLSLVPFVGFYILNAISEHCCIG